MPLYLVRWPDLTASLIRASSEADLIDRIDEVGDPGACTWQEYRGALWIDLRLDAEVHVEASQPGRLRAEEVVVDRPPPRTGARLALSFSEDADTGALAQEELLRAAFPRVGRVYRDADETGPTRADLAEALRHDLAAHDAATLGRGVTLDESVEDYRMLRTARWYFLWRHDERFTRLPASRFSDFIHGRTGLQPGTGSSVRIAAIEVEIDRRRPVRGRLASALRLGIGPRGRIVAAHRADAGDSDASEQSVAAFLARRNATVQWNLTALHERALADACDAIAPGLQLDFA
jgi:hypothetical protein